MSVVWWVWAVCTVAALATGEVLWRRIKRTLPPEDAVATLLDAARSVPTDEVLRDDESGSLFMVECHRGRTWVVSRYPAAEVDAAVSEVEDGEPVSTFPARRFIAAGKRAIASDRVFGVRRCECGDLERLDPPPESWWQFAAQLRRAELVPAGRGNRHVSD